MSRDHRKLEVFDLADRLAVQIYDQTRSWGDADRDGVRSPIRRAALSTAVNIVEGCARRSEKEYARFIDIALGSASEVAYLIDFARRVRLMSDGTYHDCKILSSRVVRSLQKLPDAIERFPTRDVPV